MKIVIFDSLGSFSKDLAAEWKAKGHEVESFKQFDGAALIGADLCFVDWADQNAIAASEKRLPIPLVVRLHSYEVFTSYPQQIRWWNVDRLVFVADHVRDFALNAFNPACPSLVIPNGVRLEDWTFRKREKMAHPKVAFTGGFDSKKGTVLLQQVFAAWPKATFHIAGPSFDTRYLVSMLDFLNKTGYKNRVFHEGYQQNLDKWLEDKDYIILTSPWEGHNVGALQAMAKGIKPLVYNFPGAENLYPEECLWLNLRELRDRADAPVYSQRYRDWVVEKGWHLEAQTDAFEKIFATPKEKTVEDVRTYYDHFLPYLEKDLERPNPRHLKIFEFIRENITEQDGVLDFGCGIGITTNEISKITKRVAGYDLSPALIERAKQLFPNIDFFVGEASTPSNDFLVRTPRERVTYCFFDCLEHLFPKQRQRMYEILDLTQPEKILITLPNRQRQGNRPMQIVDEEVSVDEIWKALPGHYISAKHSYGIDYPEQYIFLRLDKIKVESEKQEVLSGEEVG